MWNVGALGFSSMFHTKAQSRSLLPATLSVREAQARREGARPERDRGQVGIYDATHHYRLTTSCSVWSDT